jgi:sialic acid synthase SpsE
MKSYIIAEIASNWEGEIKIAKKIIRKCKLAGADAVKFQMWRAEDLYSTKHPLWKFIKKSEVTFDKAKKIKNICDQNNIEFFCSVFYPEAIDFLEKIKVKRYKIASRTCLLTDPFSVEVLEKKSKTKKPLIISMGMGGDKAKINKILKSNKKTYCYCISKYPTKFSDINWNEAVKYDGFSDHTVGITAPIVFATLKRKKNSKKIVIEKHIKLSESKGPDASSSIDTEELTQMVLSIRKIENMKI